LFDLVQLPRRRAAGRALFEASTLRVTASLVEFAARVRAGYYDLLAATRHLAMNHTIAEAALAAAELTRGQHAAGNITDLDLERELARSEEAKLALEQTEAEVLARREALMRALGLRDTSLAWALPADFLPPPAAESNAEELLALAARRRLDIAAARSEVEAARKLLPIAALRELGDVELDYHLEREPDGTRTSGPGIELPLPIFNRGRAARTRAEAQLVAGRHRLALLTGAVASELRSALVRVQAARVRVEYYRDVLLPRRRRIVELTLLEHNAMVAGVFQLLQAKQDEANGERDYIEAQREYWLARNDLDGAVNGVGMGAPIPSTTASSRSTSAAGGH
jgi:cobalt-zinc-cadmium efflux system outer membrane protein